MIPAVGGAPRALAARLRGLSSDRGSRALRRALPYLAVAPLLWLLFGTILYPAWSTLVLSLTDEGRASLRHYAEFVSYGPTLRAFRNTVVLGAATVVVCGLVGTALALAVRGLAFRGRAVVDLLLLLPIMIPGVAFTIAVMQLYGESGMVTVGLQRLLRLEAPPFALEGFWGILVIHAYTQYVFFYVNVSAALGRVDRTLVEAARGMGASRARVLRTVVLPLVTPALVAAAVLTFMSGVGSFAAPSLIGGGFRVLSVQILMSKVGGYVEFAAVQGIALSVISVAFLVLMRWAEARRDYASGRVVQPLAPREIGGPWARAALYAVLAGMAAFVALPIAAIAMLSLVEPGTWMVQIYPDEFGLGNWREFLTDPRTARPFVNSLAMAGMATGLAVVAGVAASYVITRTRLRVRWAVEVTVLLPWALPASMVAINMVGAFNRSNPLSGDVILVGTWWLLPLTYFTGILVLVVRSTNAAFAGLHGSLEEASRSLGASLAATIRRVSLPLVAPGVLAGGLLGFVVTLDEYTASALMYTVHNVPVSVATRNAMYDFDVGLAMTYGTAQIVLTMALVALVKRAASVPDLRF